MHRAFAREYGWTPEQVDALPVEFVDEQLVVWRAEADTRPKPKPARGRDG